MSRIYLDNAATSWPKPEGVYTAVDRYMRQLGAPAGRSAYDEATQVERVVAQTRRDIAGMLRVSDARRIIFTLNGTDALNMALHGLLQPGDHVVTSVVEHNSVLRPLRALEEEKQIEVTRVGCNAAGVVDPEDIRAAIAAKKNTRLVALVHASNVTGALQPVEEIGQIAHQHDALFLVDAAQSLGHLPLSADKMHADLLALLGHKGLVGPLGTGILYIGPAAEPHLRSTRQGGTGTQSENDRQPDGLPDKFESGNHNVPGIVGLGEGVRWIEVKGLDHLRRHEMELTARLLLGLEQIAGITVYGPRDATRQIGVVSLNVAGYDPQELASSLDAAGKIQVRSGLHCAPLMHRAQGTERSGGTCRISLGHFNTADQIDQTLEVLAEIAQSAIKT